MKLKKNFVIKLCFIFSILYSLYSCDGDAKIVEMQTYEVKIDTIYTYKVELKDGKSDIIEINKKYNKGDIIRYGW
jgi:hypothetical protein